MIKLIILSNHIAALPSITFLHEKGYLQAVATSSSQIEKNQIKDLCELKGITCLELNSDENMADQLTGLLNASEADLGIVFGFSKKLPASLLLAPKFGFYNIHFSLLPAYRGPAPLFWQIKRGEIATGITVHQMDESFDGGPILFQERVQLFPEETFGTLNGRLSLLAVNVIEAALEKLQAGGNPLLPQDENEAFACPSVKPSDVVINWEEQTAAEIMNLINATNPVYGGAVTMLRDQQVSIIEVSPVIINDAGFNEPGTIVYADANYGLFVACKYDSFLRVNIIQSAEGILSGYKLIAMGIQAGESFKTCMQQEAVY